MEPFVIRATSSRRIYLSPGRATVITGAISPSPGYTSIGIEVEFQEKAFGHVWRPAGVTLPLNSRIHLPLAVPPGDTYQSLRLDFGNTAGWGVFGYHEDNSKIFTALVRGSYTIPTGPDVLITTAYKGTGSRTISRNGQTLTLPNGTSLHLPVSAGDVITVSGNALIAGYYI